jgi:hypothetical protein
MVKQLAKGCLYLDNDIYTTLTNMVAAAVVA